MSSFEGPPKVNDQEKTPSAVKPAEVDAVADYLRDVQDREDERENLNKNKLPEMTVGAPVERPKIVNLVQRPGRSESRTSVSVDERAVANFFGGLGNLDAKAPLPSKGRRDVRNVKALQGIPTEKEVDVPAPILRVPNIKGVEKAGAPEVPAVDHSILGEIPPNVIFGKKEKEGKEPKVEKIESKLAPIIPLTVEEQAEIQKRREAASVIAKFTGKTQRFFGGLKEGVKNLFLEGWSGRLVQEQIFSRIDPLRVMWQKGWENRAAGKVAEVNSKLFNKKQELANTEALAKKHAVMAESLSKKGISPDVAFKLEKEKIAMRDAVLEIKRNIETLSEEVRSREKTLVSYKREREILAEGLINRVEKILAPYEKKIEGLEKCHSEAVRDVEFYTKVIGDQEVEYANLKKEYEGAHFESYRAHIKELLGPIEKQIAERKAVLKKRKADTVKYGHKIAQAERGYIWGASYWRDTKRRFEAVKNGGTEMGDPGVFEKPAVVSPVETRASGSERNAEEKRNEPVDPEKISIEAGAEGISLSSRNFIEAWQKNFENIIFATALSFELSTGVAPDSEISLEKFVKEMAYYYNVQHNPRDGGAGEFESKLGEFQREMINQSSH